MRFSTVAMALSAIFVSTRADNPVVAPDVQSSVLMVLAHAIPSQSVSYALASPAAFASEMASCLSASSTPAWYQALPTDVQSLLPQIYPHDVVSTPTPTPTPTSTPTPTPSSIKATPYPTAMNSTIAQPTMSATGSVSLALPPSGTPANPSSPAFTGAAPKLSISAGLGAVIGLIGILAL